jgi:hypothetical protein
MPPANLNVRAIRLRCSLVFALVLVGATSAGSPVAVGAEPFKSRVTANWDNIFAALPPALGGLGQANFVGTSQTTHLGKAAQRGTLALQPPVVAPHIFPGSGSVTITGANGDQLTFSYTGNLDANTGVGQGNFTFTGGTGRFANATGGGTFYAQINLAQAAPQPMTVVLDGQIGY